MHMQEEMFLRAESTDRIYQESDRLSGKSTNSLLDGSLIAWPAMGGDRKTLAFRGSTTDCFADVASREHVASVPRLTGA
jgi:hypothetical protein